MIQTTLNEWIPLTFMAFATGMDAFSVSLGIGMQKIRLKYVAWIGLVMGIFHVVMPFLGFLLAHMISGPIGHLTTLTSGALLVVIGVHMVLSSFNHETKPPLKLSGLSIMALAFLVSVDSFSVGISLGLSGTKVVMTIGLFGLVSTFLTWSGMLLGKKVHGLLGIYSEMLGGSVLCGFGLFIMFG